MGWIKKINKKVFCSGIPFLMLITVSLLSCSTADDSQNINSRNMIHAEMDTTPRITGIGGVFFVSEKPDSLQKWYKEKMGLKTDDYGAVFEFRNALDRNELNYLRWSVFKKGNDYMKPGKADMMMNYRVNDLESYVRLLQSKGVLFLDSIQRFDFGKFIHLLDADSNKIELWEPVDSVLTKIGSVTNK